MKAFSKPLTWFLSLFNFGLWNLSDTIDSLVARLHFLGLKEQAEDIARLSAQIEFQQYILVVLDGLKFLCMLVSLIVLVIANSDQLNKAWSWLKQRIWQPFTNYWCQTFLYKTYHALKVWLKTLFKNLFKSKS